MSLRSDDGIPFGFCGTVVGLHQLDSSSSCAYTDLPGSQARLVEVLWDAVVLSGDTLNSRCSDMRGLVCVMYL